MDVILIIYIVLITDQLALRDGKLEKQTSIQITEYSIYCKSSHFKCLFLYLLASHAFKILLIL